MVDTTHPTKPPAELQDEFLAVLSHELKNPLNLILVNAELLARLPQTRDIAAVARAAESIRRAVVSQAQIIDDLLDMSRVRTGKLALNSTSVNWSTALQPIVDAARREARSRQIEFAVQALRERLMVRADPVRLDQIMWNLLSNAIKYTPPCGSVRVSLGKDEGMARLDVVDTGRGIAPEFLPRVFDMFRQAEGRSTHYEGGLGIGLALVKQLVHLQDGRVQAHSEGPGRGARFSVWLPLQEKAAAPGSVYEATLADALEGLRVLVVDDAEETISALRDLLELEGLKVSGATNAQQALQLIEEQAFDLVISDVELPGMDGYELLTRLRRQGRTRHMAAIALSGRGRPADAKRALDAGFDAHLGKPLTLNALTDAMRLARERRREAAA